LPSEHSLCEIKLRYKWAKYCVYIFTVLFLFSV